MVRLENVLPRTSLLVHARRARDPFERISVRHAEVGVRVSEGWEVDRKLKSVTRLYKPKSPDKLHEDRFWTVLFGMGFLELSGAGGGRFVSGTNRTVDQLDAVAMDEEVLLIAECKVVGPRTRLNYAEVLGRLHGLRERASQAVRNANPDQKVKIAPCLLVSGARPPETAFERSAQLGVPIFTDQDLEYYETLTNYIGPAARFQLMADLLPGKQVEGLEITLPAIRGKMGGSTFYSFSIHPEHLLKVSFVAHRLKGSNVGSTSYQRMIKKSRLKSIQKFIQNGGMFPTSIVVNLKSKPRFNISAQDSRDDDSRMGWLTLSGTYKSAWVIDGQHRLYAYSGLDEAESEYVSVLAFEQLDEQRQADLFVDINSQQKSVPSSLLTTLQADLHWDSTDPSERAQAVISRAIQELGTEDSRSPFFGRIAIAEATGDASRNITVHSAYNKLKSTNLLFERKSGSKNVAFGPLWFEADNDAMVRRIRRILDAWFGEIRDSVPEWWELGKSEGGGLSMSDSVIAHIDVLAKVFEHLCKQQLIDWTGSTDQELMDALRPFAKVVGGHLASLTQEERKNYRALYGSPGQAFRSRSMQVSIRKNFSQFDPLGLDDFIESQKTETKQKAKDLLDSIELMVKQVVVDTLKAEHPDGDDWWIEGVPVSVKKEVSNRREEDK